MANVAAAFPSATHATTASAVPHGIARELRAPDFNFLPALTSAKENVRTHFFEDCELAEFAVVKGQGAHSKCARGVIGIFQ